MNYKQIILQLYDPFLSQKISFFGYLPHFMRRIRRRVAEDCRSFQPRRAHADVEESIRRKGNAYGVVLENRWDDIGLFSAFYAENMGPNLRIHQ